MIAKLNINKQKKHWKVTKDFSATNFLIVVVPFKNKTNYWQNFKMPKKSSLDMHQIIDCKNFTEFTNHIYLFGHIYVIKKPLNNPPPPLEETRLFGHHSRPRWWSQELRGAGSFQKREKQKPEVICETQTVADNEVGLVIETPVKLVSCHHAVKSDFQQSVQNQFTIVLVSLLL